MTRKFKNVALVLLMIIMIVAIGAAMYIGATQGATGMGAGGQGDMSMSIPGNSQDSSQGQSNATDSSSSSNQSEPPAKLDGDSQSNGSTGQSNGSSGQKSTQTDNSIQTIGYTSSDAIQTGTHSDSSDHSASDSSSTDQSTPPEKPDGDSSNGQGQGDGQGAQGDQGGMPGGDMQGMNQNQGNSLGIPWYILFAALSLVLAVAIVYMIASKANWYSWRAVIRSRGRIAIYILATIVVAGGLTVGEVFASTNVLPNLLNSQEQEEQETSVEAKGATEVTDEETLNAEYSSSSEDESAILVKDGGALTLTNATLTKTGDSSNTENSEFYGINAGLLVTENSTATIKGAKISTSAAGSNAVFSTGDNSKITISDSTITTSGDSSARGLDATYGGYIEGDNLTITTKGGSCAALATDRGEGTVKVKSSKLMTSGSGSPVIYSTGDISIEDTIGTASGAQMVVVEGKNSATVTSSTLKASAVGNRNNVDDGGVMIYQSMSGDASEGTGTFTATDSSLAIDDESDVYETAPMFFLTNTEGVINLTNTKLSFGSGILLKAIATDEWGNSGENGADVTLNATEQTLSGDVILDSISTISMNLESSTYRGTINGDNKASKVTLKLDKKSKITLTGDSYVTELDDTDSSYSNIDFNGHKLYVNGKAIN